MEGPSREEIVRQMSAIRMHLDGEVGGIMLNARRLADWRYYVRTFPWISILGAAATGFLVVPRKPAPAAVFSDAVASGRAALAGTGPSEQTKTAAAGGILGSLAGLASSFAFKMAMQYATQQFKNHWAAPRSSESNTAATPRPMVPR